MSAFLLRIGLQYKGFPSCVRIRVIQSRQNTTIKQTFNPTAHNQPIFLNSYSISSVCFGPNYVVLNLYFLNLLSSILFENVCHWIVCFNLNDTRSQKKCAWSVKKKCFAFTSKKIRKRLVNKVTLRISYVHSGCKNQNARAQNSFF